MDTLRYYFFWLFINLDLIALVFVFFAAIAFYFKHRNLGIKLVYFSILPLLFTYILPTGPLMIAHLEDMVKRPDLPKESEIEGIIMLGGAFALIETSERGSPVYNPAGARMLEFIELAHKYPNTKVILTGNKIEAEMGERVLLAHNIDKSRLVIESGSRGTEDHPKNLETIIDKTKTYLLVTSAFHMPRGLLLFQAADDYKVIPYPVDYHTSGKINFTTWMSYLLQRFNPIAFKQAFREWAGLTTYYAKGVTRQWYPKDI